MKRCVKKKRAGIEREWECREDKRVLRGFRHIEIMDKYRMAKKVLMAEVSGVRVIAPSTALVFYHLERGVMSVHDTFGVNCENGSTTEYQCAGA